MKTLIRLGGCSGWSESSLGVHSFLLMYSCTSISGDTTFMGSRIVRIFNVCEVRIENFVTRVTVWHHEARRVVPNSYPEWRNFQFTPNKHYRFFSLHTLLSPIVLQWNSSFIWQPNSLIPSQVKHVIQTFVLTFYRGWPNDLWKYIFDQEMYGSAPIYDVLTSCTWSSYTPLV